MVYFPTQAGVEWEWGRAGRGLQGQGPCRGQGERAEPPALLKLPGSAAQCSAGLPVDVLGPSETEEPGREPPANPLHPAGTLMPGDTLGLLHHQWGPPHPKPSCLHAHRLEHPVMEPCCIPGCRAVGS